MADDLFLIESCGILHSHKPRWDRKDDYGNLRRAVSLIESMEPKILTNDHSKDMSKLRYGIYVREHYLPERKRLASIGWKRGDDYPSETCPYYIWRDAHTEIAWEYLRRSSDYKTYFSRYMRVLGNCFPRIADYVTSKFGDSKNKSEAYREFIDAYKVKGDLHEAWRILSHSKECKLYFDYVDEDIGEIWTIKKNIQISEERIYEIFNLLPHFGVTHPDCNVPPVFLRYTKPVKVIGTKHIMKEEVYCLEESVFSPFEMGIILSFRLDENIEDQLFDARKKIESMCNVMGFGMKIDVYNESRPRLGKHEHYIRLIDANNDSVTSPNVIGPVLYKNYEIVDITKNVEKAIQAAEGLTRYGHYQIATAPFRK
ncbi:hypothetical protein [Azospirillum griseum]|uniref:Uncharacterized protein n=1 Tax=Azospirillum griseum TaxID=2496639 RepID=A0A3S0IB06_9PROT|nr:hypothetical protein [Azospirillum griseum]RTR11622.1 hypothetical protein EJ903_26000 [Azospirillum griseum]